MRFTDSLRRPDWLDELHTGLGVATVLSGLGAAAGLVALLAGEPVEVDVATAAAPIAGLPAGVVAGTSVQVEVPDPSVEQVVWSTLSHLPSYALVTAVLLLLWRLVGRVRRDGPFTPAVAGRLRALGLLLVVGGPATWVLESVARLGLSSTVTAEAAYVGLDFAGLAAWLLAGTAVFAIREIIRRGQALRTELDGVV